MQTLTINSPHCHACGTPSEYGPCGCHAGHGSSPSPRRGQAPRSFIDELTSNADEERAANFYSEADYPPEMRVRWEEDAKSEKSEMTENARRSAGDPYDGFDYSGDAWG